MINNITDSIFYVGTNDHELDMFEGQYVVPNGMAYNSYVIKDDKTVVFDTMERKNINQWLANVKETLGGESPDYLIVQHMEPDHSAAIQDFVKEYPQTTLVGNRKTFAMINQFFPEIGRSKTLEVKDGDVLELGHHNLTFVFAPMVHWPEVMMTYESTEKVLFSADAFGKFGALDIEEEWACEARRYYINIVGKYGVQVQNVLNKAANLDIQMICPLHGPILRENLGDYMELYDIWSSYRPETEGVCICYTSVYGNTKAAVETLAQELSNRGVAEVVVNDLARCDMAEAVEDAFRYDRLVLATTTYNSDIFPFMKTFIEHLIERNFQKRKVAFIENGTWAPTAMKHMKKAFEASKELVFAENNVTIKSALNDTSKEQITALARELSEVVAEEQPETGEKLADTTKYECKICGYIYEGADLPADFQCPLCGQGPEAFASVQ